MRLLISHKLFLALLTATAVVVVVALVLTRLSFNRGFLDYVNAVEAERIATVVDALGAIYAETGSWDGLLDRPERWEQIMAAFVGERAGMRGARRPPSAGRRPPPDRRPPGRQGGPLDLLDANQQLLLGRPDGREAAMLAPINRDARLVGYVRYVPTSALADLDNAAEQQFVAQQRTALYITAVAAFVIAALLAALFGRRLVTPLKTLATGTEQLAAGKLDQRIPVTRKDELGQLAESFNAMATALEQAQRTQQQWLADVAHELRTPLTILTGELQAIEDGIRAWTPATRESMQSEIDRLSALVEDLREVSLADAGGLGYQRRELDLRDIITDALDSYANRIAECGLSVDLDLPDREVLLSGDARRLEQVLTNLLENSCRYTDAGGVIRVRCEGDDPVTVVVADSAPGVPADALPRLFDRLFRADASRNRGYGGSGLGLAICKGIVEAHGGTISAAPAALGGLAITFTLPGGETS